MSQFNPNPSDGPQHSGGSTQLVIIAGVVALVGVILMNIYVEVRAKATAEGTIPLFRLKIDKKDGDELRPDDIEIVYIPTRFKEAFGGDVLPMENGEPLGGYSRFFQHDVKLGQVLTHSMFSTDVGSTIAAEAERNHRLFTIKVDSRNQPPNLGPGDFVDVYAYFIDRRGSAATLVIERVKVLTVGDRITQSGDGSSSSTQNTYGNISIQLPVALVAPMMTIQKHAEAEEFNIALRNRDDHGSTLVEGAELSDINPEVLQKFGLEVERPVF